MNVQQLIHDVKDGKTMTIADKISLDRVNETLTKDVRLTQKELQFLVILLCTKCFNMSQKQRDLLSVLYHRSPNSPKRIWKDSGLLTVETKTNFPTAKTTTKIISTEQKEKKIINSYYSHYLDLDITIEKLREVGVDIDYADTRTKNKIIRQNLNKELGYKVSSADFKKAANFVKRQLGN